MTHTTDPTARDPREDLLDALDFAFVVGPLGYGSREELLAAYDASRVPVSPPADPTALRDRIAGALYVHDHPNHLVPLNETGMERAYRESADAVLAVLPPPANRAVVCICGHPEHQHFEDVCITEITGCQCGDFLLPEAAAEVIDRWRQAAIQARADRAAVLHDAELLHVLDAYLTATHVARHDVIGENGTCAGCALQKRLRAELRRVAAEEQPTQTSAVDLSTLAAALDGIHTLIATSSRDWGTYRVDAWLWAVLCGWDCEEAHEHDELCDDGAAMREMAERHGWDEAAVAKARRYRAAVRALTEPAARPVVGEQPDTQTLRCVCGHPVQLQDADDPTSWIHTPGRDNDCIDARPRCPHCQLPHDLTPGSLPVTACESIRARITAEEPPVVAYRNPALTELHCLRCAPHPAGDIWTPVTAEELEDGGICAVCGADVLIEVKPS